MFGLDSTRTSIEEAYLIKQGHLPKSIFKYRSFNEYAIKNLVDDTIWLADPSSLNDPYDCSHWVDLDQLAKMIFRRELPTIIKLNKQENVISPEVINQIMSSNEPFISYIETMLLMEPIEKREELRHISTIEWEQMKESNSRNASNYLKGKLKLCSFSERLDSIVMWSHYADLIRGLCIEYDITSYSCEDYQRKHLYPVIYSDTMVDATRFVILKVNGDDVNRLFPLLVGLVKARDWSYEREWRLIFQDRIIEHEQAYPMVRPQAVYILFQNHAEAQEQLITICKSKDVPYFKMKGHLNRFELEPVSVEEVDRSLLEYK